MNSWGLIIPLDIENAAPESLPRRVIQLLFLASSRGFGRRLRFSGITEHRLQGTDFDNGAPAASCDDGDGTNSHVGSCEQFGVNLVSMHSIQGNIALMLMTALPTTESASMAVGGYA